MGWSCNAAASLTLTAIGTLMSASGAKGSNSIMAGNQEIGFWETSRVEHNDGAITGSVYVHVDERHCRKVGGFRIEPNGKVTRFPRMPRPLLNRAETIGAIAFRERYGDIQADHENVKKVS